MAGAHAANAPPPPAWLRWQAAGGRRASKGLQVDAAGSISNYGRARGSGGGAHSANIAPQWLRQAGGANAAARGPWGNGPMSLVASSAATASTLHLAINGLKQVPVAVLSWRAMLEGTHSHAPRMPCVGCLAPRWLQVALMAAPSTRLGPEGTHPPAHKAASMGCLAADRTRGAHCWRPNWGALGRNGCTPALTAPYGGHLALNGLQVALLETLSRHLGLEGTHSTSAQSAMYDVFGSPQATSGDVV